MSTCDPNRGCPPSVPNVHCAYPKCAHGEAKNPAPVSATERDAVREQFRETHNDGLVTTHIHPTNNVVDEIIRLRARVAELERVTEEQVDEPLCVTALREYSATGSEGLYTGRQRSICDVSDVLDYIDMLHARLSVVESPTDAQVERAAIAYFEDSLMATTSDGQRFYVWEETSEIVRNAFLRSMRLALTAARGGG